MTKGHMINRTNIYICLTTVDTLVIASLVASTSIA